MRMHLRESLLLGLVLTIITGAGFAQSTPPPPTGIGPPPISDIDRLNRQYDNLERRTDTMATLKLSYKSSGELTSSLEKQNPQGLFIRAEVNGTPVKKLAKGQKRAVARGIEPGILKVEATWSRPGTRFKTKCEAPLEVGYQQAWILPYGGNENFSCVITPRSLPEEALAEWKETLSGDAVASLSDCSRSEEVVGNGFWACIERAGLPLPPG